MGIEMRSIDDLDEDLKAEDWMLDLVKLNPDYVYWGVYEDYMTDDKTQWASRIIKENWTDFGPWDLDDLNECVNFYFEILRENKECETCNGNGYHPDAQYIANTFYRHSSPDGTYWHDKITEDEADMLYHEKRVHQFVGKDKPKDYKPSASEINDFERNCTLGHDAINRSLLIRQRLTRLGLPIVCPTCAGSGLVYTTEQANVALTLWMLHPRKGCSRGVRINHIHQDDVASIKQWLIKARDRNYDRFAKIKLIAKPQ
jgi:hypothetical protein